MTRSLKQVLASFVDAIAAQVNAQELEDLLAGRSVPDGRTLGGYEPEAFIEDELIYPIIEDVLGLEKQRFPYSDNRNPMRPDFELGDLGIIGENKVLNNYQAAVADLEDRYLRDKGIDEDFGIATDGFKWGLIRIDTGGDFRQIDRIAEIDLRGLAQEYAVSKNLVAQPSLELEDTDKLVSEFLDTFSRDGLTYHLDAAPQRYRDRLQGSIDEFYDLYITLLFGKGRGDRSYDTTLMEDVEGPPEATEIEERVFAITLVNRLLFIKLLEEGDVLPEGFLSDRVEQFEESKQTLAGDVNLYEDQIKPIFYELFNTPQDERSPRHRQSDVWFSQVPYLNGGLFRENVEGEREYTVRDRILPTLISDLIEGHKLHKQSGLDPAVLGNVFEMTINYISGEEGRQKDIGAFYTPSDASRLVAKQTVDKAIRDALLDVYAEYHPELRSREGDFPLSKLLRWIEDQKSWFGDPGATEEAFDRLGELKILDPACGSGHFLTSAVTELHQARLSLMRAMGWHEEDDWGARVYQAKEEVVTNAIYGVDIDPVAVEIAKLRVWLKIIEEGWEEGYGRLPNIDLNIITGNSLIGLPEPSHDDITLDLFEDRVHKIEELRDEYKQENEDVRGEISSRLEVLNEKLNQRFLQRLDRTYSFKLDAPEFSDLATSPVFIDESNFADRIANLTFKKPDADDFTKEEQDWLDAHGFHTNPAWGATARLVLKDDEAMKRAVVDVVKEALEYGLHITKLDRYPVQEDLEAIEGPPLHWIANFPEALDEKNGNGGFDVLIGNPPYGGDVLSKSARALIAAFKTSGVRDIVAPFIERALHLLREGGYYGNVVTLRIVYQDNMSQVRDLLRQQLGWGRIACFARRPTQVFKGCQVRVGIVVGRKDTASGPCHLHTSEFLRFFDNNEKRERDKTFETIKYASPEGLGLGDRIGSGDKSLPKVGTETVRTILSKLRDNSDVTFADVMDRTGTGEGSSDHVLYRRRGISYFMNPLLEDLYPNGERPGETKPVNFDSLLHRNAAFLVLQSSLFYTYWMAYGDERHLNWTEVDAMPFPSDDELEQRSADINQLADTLWDEMVDRWVGGSREVIRETAALKGLMDKADDLLGPMYGLEDPEIEFVKRFQESYRLSGLDDSASEVIDQP